MPMKKKSSRKPSPKRRTSVKKKSSRKPSPKRRTSVKKRSSRKPSPKRRTSRKQVGGGTSCRVTIKSIDNRVAFFLRKNGSIEGIGQQICQIMKKILKEKFKNEKDFELFELKEGEQKFEKIDDLIKLFDGTNFANDYSVDVAYKYTIDMRPWSKKVSVKYFNHYKGQKDKKEIKFKDIEKGVTFYEESADEDDKQAV
jgi:hypothetical protein